jgi:hypothetical protein
MKNCDIDEIIKDFLYLGSSKGSKELDCLNYHKITHIVNISGKQYFPNDFIYFRKHFKDKDDVNIIDQLDDIFNFIDEAKLNQKNRLFVHCQGINNYYFIKRRCF